MQMMFDMVQKKGDRELLDGRVTVYAVIDMDPAELMTTKHTFASMVHSGFLVSQGNFKDQYNFRDFLKSELGITLEDGLEQGLAQLLERMDGLESTLDPQKLKERLESMDDLNDLIPTPAKIVPFHTEEEILTQEGDVFFAGTFRNVGNAVLTVQALPMLYQARFREQEAGRIKNEIETLISQIEKGDSRHSLASPETDADKSTEEHLLRDFIPNMLYSRKEARSFDATVREFRAAMKQYRFPEDIDAIIAIISSTKELTEKDNRLLELYTKKITSVEKEDFKAVDAVAREIKQLRDADT
ncbi:MAG: hypothetical protein JW768_05100 [Chitinispirillaceae bacterium]|nr:hypothetical protein [Chitinispirillaceae bacterium]